MRVTSHILRDLLHDLVGRRLAALWDVVDGWVVLVVVLVAVGYAVRAGMRRGTGRRRVDGREALLRGLENVAASEVQREYRPSDGSEAVYRFEFVRRPDGSWRSYILSQPSYGRRSPSDEVTHRLSDARGRYVCFIPEPRSLRDAGRVAAAWADATQRYVRTGRF